MIFRTVDHWEEELWQKWQNVYAEAFDPKKAKSKKVIQNMFQKQTCYFHIAMDGSEVCAIALSGKLPGTSLLLIDYFAVRGTERNRGIGKLMFEYLEGWAIESVSFDCIVIEVEAEQTDENLARIQFWKKCGFTLTSYIHHYKVVPEPYQALYRKLYPEAAIPDKEETFFRFIGKFHRKSFQGV